ncbi:MAG: rhodanese-like domain-containing protein [Gammaproteobacteria bacterium]|nr:rhodanese-like domain-containing protein [Gammaproteobacteria bacterium]
MRVRYPDVAVISTEDLSKRLSEVVVIDVRSQYEFDTLHILGSVNVSVDKANFRDAVIKLRQQHDKPFVFYCNGKTCHKAYDAVLLADKARVDRLMAYDAGIFDWSKKNPDKAVLLGKNPINPNDLISEDRFKARLLDAKDFASRVGDKSIVLDLRDRKQRDSALFPFKEQRAQIDEAKKIDEVISEARAQHKTLLVYDAVGKQVQWVQYYLESRGLKDYYFMKGGAQAYFDSTLGKVELGSSEKPKKPAK